MLVQVGANEDLDLLSQNGIIAALHPDADIKLHQKNMVVESSAPWHLDRIDQASLPLDHQYHYTLDGSGIHVYVFDTVMAVLSPLLHH